MILMVVRTFVYPHKIEAAEQKKKNARQTRKKFDLLAKAVHRTHTILHNKMIYSSIHWFDEVQNRNCNNLDHCPMKTLHCVQQARNTYIYNKILRRISTGMCNNNNCNNNSNRLMDFRDCRS